MIAHEEIIKSLHVSLESASVGCRHLEWLPVPGSVSPVCPSSSGVGPRREKPEASGFWCFNACKTVTLHALQGFHWPSTAMGELVFGKFFLVEVRCILCFDRRYHRNEISDHPAQQCQSDSSMVARVAGWRLIPRVTSRSGPLARDCGQGFSVGVACWLETDLEGDGLEWKAGMRMFSRVSCRSGKLVGGSCTGGRSVS